MAGKAVELKILLAAGWKTNIYLSFLVLEETCLFPLQTLEEMYCKVHVSL